MSEINQINIDFNNNINKIYQFYRYHFNRVNRMRINRNIKNNYFYQLKKYCINLINNLKQLRDQKIKEYYANLNRINNSNSDNKLEKLNYKGLMIGINYINNNYNISQLSGCIDDVNRLKDCLINNKKINFENLIFLNDNTEIKPTKYNILNQLKKLLIESKENDVLIFAYSGHGHYIYDFSNDENDNRDEVIVSIDGQLIKDDEFRSIITENLKEKVTLFVFFDCCHSGTLMDLKYNYLSKNNYNELVINNNYQETKGDVFFISGCKDNQYSVEAYLDGERQGALTWSFIDCIENSSKISWKNLILNMREKIKQKKFNQIPQFSSGKNIDINSDFIF